MFTTQLIGLLKGIQEREDLSMEDAARLLSQALVGEGHVYLYGAGEMNAITSEALYGKERLPKFLSLFDQDKMVDLNSTDRVLLLTRSSADKTVLAYAKEIALKQIPIVVISSIDEHDRELVDLADVHLDLNLTTSLVPTETGERVGYPASLAGLYVYFCLYLLINDFLEEYE